MQADYAPLLKAINQLRLCCLGLQLPALAPLPDRMPVIQLDLPELEELTVDVQVGVVDVRGCPMLFECRRRQAPAAAVAELPIELVGGIPGVLEGDLLESIRHRQFQGLPGPYEASPEDGLLLARAGSWKYGDWINGSWKYKGEYPGWCWSPEADDE